MRELHQNQHIDRRNSNWEALGSDLRSSKCTVRRLTASEKLLSTGVKEMSCADQVDGRMFSDCAKGGFSITAMPFRRSCTRGVSTLPTHGEARGECSRRLD